MVDASKSQADWKWILGSAAAGLGLGFVFLRWRRGRQGTPFAEDLNADLSRRVLVRTRLQPWMSSPSATVERKRVYREGPMEGCAVTALVRYLPAASFRAHPHPQGEEIFVLEGTFSDQRGDHTAGTFLLNPEGFSHAPSSIEGNEILVRLRQYPNMPDRPPRPQCAVDSRALAWALDAAAPGVATKVLYDGQPEYPERQWLERWETGAAVRPVHYPDGLEVLVIRGSFSDSQGEYGLKDWLRLPKGTTFAPAPGPEGCELLCKSGGLPFAGIY